MPAPRHFLWLGPLCWLACALPSPAAEPAAAAPANPPARWDRPLEERGAIVVGAATDTFPFCFLRPDNTTSGFAVELLDAVAQTVQLPLRREIVTGLDTRVRFRKGDFDFLEFFAQTEERAAYTDFSVPFLTLHTDIFVRDQRNRLRTITDLQGKRLAVVGRDSVGAQFANEAGFPIELIVADSTEESLRMLDAGTVDAVLATRLATLAIVERLGLRRITMLAQLQARYDIRACYGVHKGDAQLLARLNEGLAMVHQNGEYDRLFNKWFGRFSSPLISRKQVINYALGGLSLALALTLWALLRQRALRRRIVGQKAELARQQALLQALYDNIPMAMCVFEAAPNGHRVLSTNRTAADFFGRPASELVGLTLDDLPREAEWTAHLVELLQHGLAAHAPLREERRLTAARKRLVFTLVSMDPAEGGCPRLCLLAEDITERRNIDEEIAQSRKLRAVGELVGGIAHEFNNLLTPIMLKIGEIQADWPDDSELIEETRLIAESVKRAAELTRRLLTFGRKSDLRSEEVNLGALIATCFSLLRLTMERRIVWEQDVPADLPPIVFNPTDLNQIILNLILNARDTLVEKLAVRRGEWNPLIRVEVRLLPANALPQRDSPPTPRTILGWQRLTVRDNGMGMTNAVRERVFEPFFTTKEIGKGTGLGLATVWNLVTAASGRIEVESSPGEGTAIHVFLPMLPNAAPATPALPARHVGSQSARVLLAEDDAMVAKTLLAALRRAHHQVTHFLDGAIAWQHLQGHLEDFDLLIFDVNMPGLDGLELAHRVRATGQYQGRIMITSGRLGSDDLEQVGSARIDYLLSKPFEISELLGAVSDTLAARTAPKQS